MARKKTTKKKSAKKAGSKKNTNKKEKQVNRSVFLLVAGVVAIALVITLLITGLPVQSSFEDSSETVAEVNGQKVTENDVILSQKLLSTQTSQPVAFEVALEHAIMQQLLIEEAGARGYVVSREDAEAHLSEFIAGQGQDLEAEKASLEEQGEDYETLLEGYRVQLLVGQLLEEEISPPEPTQAEMEAFYEQNKEQFKQGDTYIPYFLAESQIKATIIQEQARANYINFINVLKKDAQIMYLTENHIGQNTHGQELEIEPLAN